MTRITCLNLDGLDERMTRIVAQMRENAYLFAAFALLKRLCVKSWSSFNQVDHGSDHPGHPLIL